MPISTESGRSLRVLGTPEGLADFDTAYSEPASRKLVKKIRFEIELPSISIKRLKKLQSSTEANKNNEAFTRGAVEFFQRLATWEDRGEDGIHLTVVVQSPTDSQIDNYVKNGELSRGSHGYATPIWEIRSEYKYIDFIAECPFLPSVACVTKLDFEAIAGRNYHPNAFFTISNALPRAQNIEWWVMLPSRRLMQARREIRSALATALQRATLTSVCQFAISIQDIDPGNQNFPPGNLLDGEDMDDLSLAVRRICQLTTLRTLELKGTWILSAEAFGQIHNLPDLFCPSLETLMIECSATSPGGEWLITGNETEAQDEDYISDSSSHAAFNSNNSDTSDFPPQYRWDIEAGEIPDVIFRTTPDPNTFVPLISSFANAVMSHMPKLESMEIMFGSSTTSSMEIVYLAAGKRLHGNRDLHGEQTFDQENIHNPRWYIFANEETDETWRLAPELQQELEGQGGNGRIHMAIGDKRII